MLMRIGIAFILFSFITPCLGGENETKLSTDEQRLKEAMIKYSDRIIEILVAEIKNYNPRYDGSGQHARWLKKKLAMFRKQPYQIPQLYPWSLKPGDIGQLTGSFATTAAPNKKNSFHVFQVIDDNNMLVRSPDGGIATDEANNAIRRSAEKIIWVSGISTKGVVDDSRITLGYVYEVTGTKRYGTAAGSNTVSVIAPFAIQFRTIKDEKELLDNSNCKR